ncbi:MAG: phage gp6-like head-tail connector protein [Selenomonadaceae bacterium]|nr:phage gp6-like head-tail connector protein [Selenomonadaceae bacterium]
MVTLAKLKSYLRIDTDYEDDLLENFIETARAYLVDAISDFEENYSVSEKFADKADLLTMIIATEFYQNRDNSAHDFSYTIKSLMVQLQNFIVEGGD